MIRLSTMPKKNEPQSGQDQNWQGVKEADHSVVSLINKLLIVMREEDLASVLAAFDPVTI